jgi:hypothetical protein
VWLRGRDGSGIWIGHSSVVWSGLDGRAVVLGVLTVVVALGLGAWAGSRSGAAAGAITVVAGLASSVIAGAAVDRRARNLARLKEQQQVLRRFAPPGPTGDGEDEKCQDGRVAWYLRPEEQVVAFRSRPELDELVAWCVGDGHATARLVTSDGGAGKTRLALRLGQELAANGWQQLWVGRGSEREAVGAVRTMGQPCLLVVDYAETRTDLEGLLDDVAADLGGPDIRVLLLARSAGEWWQTLLASAEEQAAALVEAAPLELGPVPAAGGPQELFAEALAAFARRLQAECPDERLPLADPDPLVLVIHASALLTVLDHGGGAGKRQVSSAMKVLEDLIGHEARYWVKSAAARGLTVDLSVLRLAVALGCLVGADSQISATALLSRIPDLEDSAERRGQVARWLHDLYPVTHADDPGGREWLGPLRPDRLAEQLVTSELADHPELIPRIFAGLPADRAARGLTVLARAAMTDDRAVGLLHRALAADLDHLAVPACLVAVETNPVLGELLSQVISGQPVARKTLLRVATESPYPSFALAAPAAVVLQRLGKLGRRES